MTDTPADHTLALLRELRAHVDIRLDKIAGQLHEIASQVGTLAQGQLFLRNDLRSQGEHVNTISIAITAHSQRLDRIDDRLDHIDARLNRIDQHLGLDKPKH